MSTILALDTTTDTCSVALTLSGTIEQSLTIAAREHTQRLLPMVEALMTKTGVSLKELEAIAYGCGPGSFTGLRICLSTAQGLAYGADLPLVPVSSLFAMAQGAVRLKSFPSEQNTLIVPAIDARMDEIYWSIYRMDAMGQLQQLCEEQVSSPETCRQAIASLGHEGLCGVGSAWHYSSLQSSLQGIDHVDVDHEFTPQAYDIAELALDMFNSGDTIQPMDAQPVYLRNEVSWQKRKRIRPRL